MGVEKETWVIAILLVSLSLAFGLIPYYQVFVLNQTNLTSISACKSIKSEGLKQQCIYNLAVKLKNLTVCDNLYGGGRCSSFSDCPRPYFTQKQCVENVIMVLSNRVIESHNYFECAGIGDCIDKVIFYYNDTKSCGNGSSSRNDCLSKIADLKGDSGICLDIDDVKTRDWCIRQIAPRLNRSDVCFQIQTNDSRDECIKQFAENIQNSTLCEYIQNNEWKDDCFSYVATTKNQSELCNNIKNIDVKDECIKSVAIKRKDPILCKKIAHPIKKDDCNLNLAKNLNSLDLCYTIDNPDVLENCIYHVSIIFNNSLFCDLLNNSDLINLCSGYFTNLNVTKYARLCEYLPEKESDECFYRFSIESNDVNICKNITGNANGCFIHFSQTLKNSTYCEFTSGDDCYLEYAIKFKEFEFCSKTTLSQNNCWKQAFGEDLDENDCLGLKNSSGCFFVLAVDNSDFYKSKGEFCEKSRDPDLCYEVVAERTRNITWCRFSEKNLRCVDHMLRVDNYEDWGPKCTTAQNCSIEYKEEDMRYCSSLAGDVRVECFIATASIFGDPKLCLEVPLDINKCLLNIARLRRQGVGKCELAEFYGGDCLIELFNLSVESKT